MSYSSVTLPKVDCDYVEPIMDGWAHCVFESSPSSDEKNTTSTGGKIYLGSQQSQRNALAAVSNPSITGIVNCTSFFPNFHEPSIEYCRVATDDVAGADILIYLDGATQFINRHISRGGSVLVHCQMGVSRSATVVIAYLMRYHSMLRAQAYRYVKVRRPLVRPNGGFWMQLQVFQARLKNSGNHAESVAIQFDKRWAEQSLANYQTIGHFLTPTEFFMEIPSPSADYEKIIFVAADFVFGRGIQDADLPWFGALCLVLSKCNCDILDVLAVLLTERSDFAELWSGEIYPLDVERIMTVVRSALRHEQKDKAN